MTKDQKDWIDNASYEQLLRRWRAPGSDPIFQGETGQYYAEAMRHRRAEVGHSEAVAASKRIGHW